MVVEFVSVGLDIVGCLLSHVYVDGLTHFGNSKALSKLVEDVES